MPFTGFSFDESVAQTEPGRPHVPEGYYLFEGVKIDPTPENYERTTGILATVKFIEGPDATPGAGVGREMRDYSALGAGKKNDRGTQFGLGQLLGAFGLTDIAKKLPGQNITSYAQFENFCGALTRQFAGKRAVGLVADQSGTNGRAFSGVEEWLPEAEWPTLKRAGLSPMVGPRVSAPNGAATAAPSPAAVEQIKNDVMALFENNA